MTCVALCVAGCSSDEKDPEIVPDPMDAEEYFISGSVVDYSTSAGLSGVTVSLGDQTATTGSDGKYEVIVSEKKTYEVTFAKDQYVGATTEATIASGTANRSLVTLSVKLTKKSTPVSVGDTGGVVGDSSTGTTSSVTATLPEGAVPAGTTASISVTPVTIPTAASTSTATGTSSVSVPLAALAFESTVATFSKPVTLAVKDLGSSDVYFSDVTVYSSGVSAVTKAATG